MRLLYNRILYDDESQTAEMFLQVFPVPCYSGFHFITTKLLPYCFSLIASPLLLLPFSLPKNQGIKPSISREKSDIEFRGIQFRSGFNHQVIINYPLSIIN